MTGIDHVAGTTCHVRHGAVQNAFRYGIDYVLLEPERAGAGPRLFSRGRANLMSLRDRDHGGPPGTGDGAAWVRRVLRDNGLATGHRTIELLAQPRVLGHVFNPVSFWLVRDGAGALRVAIAEVSNTFGDRHSYLCHRDDGGPIGPDEVLEARKAFHVSPFRDIVGTYRFRFDVTASRVEIRIEHRADDGERLVATLSGPRRPLSDVAILRACLRRPFGSRRVLALIHWQAVRLWWKGARYRRRPMPPRRDVSR